MTTAVSHIPVNRWKTALDVQSACNLSGVVHDFSRVVSELWDEANRLGEGTDWVNRHPICRLYAEQIMHLAGGGMGGTDTYHAAYQQATEATEGGAA